jgi:heme a synthase
MASFVSGLRRAAPRLPRDFFVCHQCLSRAVPTRSTSIAGKFAVLRSIRYKSTTSVPSRASSTAATAPPLTSLSQTVGSSRKTSNRNFFPETSSKSVGYWLLGSAASVFGIVVFGGLTRLTESGYVASNHYHALTENNIA